jgi:hypothetical protein
MIVDSNLIWFDLILIWLILLGSGKGGVYFRIVKYASINMGISYIAQLSRAYLNLDVIK